MNPENLRSNKYHTAHSMRHNSNVHNIHAAVKISEVRFANPLMNGAYIHSKTLEDITQLVQASSGAVVVGSISVKPRKSNPGPGYWKHKEQFFSLNSFGLPNGGLPYFRKALPKMVALAHKAGKPLIANVVGFSAKEFVKLVRFCETADVDMVELNLGCPNVWEGSYQKQIISYHPESVRSVVNAIRMLDPKIPVCIKLSPLPPDILMEVVQVIVESKAIQAVTATNSYPNAAITTGARGVDDSSDILTGLAGRALKPVSVGVVKQLRQTLPKNIAIFGCGGISSHNDVQDYLDAGAQAVQIATALCDEGASVFDKILYQSRSKT